jgi:membrane-associated phospholipid phosphatase
VTSARQAMLTRMAGRMWWLPLVPVGFLTDRSSRWRWLLMPGIVIFTALTSSIGKLVIRRPRPDSSYRAVPLGRLGAASFPSTHSACAFAIAGWLRASRHGRWLHGLAVFIGCSRVRCRAHHSTDVVAGAVLGYGIAWQVERIWSRLAVRRAARVVGSADERRRVRSFELRTIEASSRNRSLRSRDHIAAPVGHELSLRSARRQNGAAPAHERGTKGAPLEVS